LKALEGFGPHLVEVSAQAGYSLRIELIKTARSGAAVKHKPGIFEHFQMLRNGRTADRESSRQLMDGQWPPGKPLEDCHARGVAKGIESGLEVSIHFG